MSFAASAAVAIAGAERVADALGIERTSLLHRVRRGRELTAPEADRVAVYLGLLPTDIWPEWGDEQDSIYDLPLTGDWAAKGRCRSAPKEVFFPAPGDSIDPAKAICADCPVREQCLDYALAHPRLQGVWGGTSGKERRLIHQGAMARPSVEPAPAGTRTRTRKGELYRTLSQLLDHPGRWARVASYGRKETASSQASFLRHGHRAVPPGRWSFEARVNGEGGSDLYARLDEPAVEEVA